MKKFTRILLFFLIPVFTTLGLIVSYNYILDPYGVIKEDFSSVTIEPNQRCIKEKLIIEHPNQFDSFLMGSSRVGYIDISPLQSEHDAWYNMSYSEAVASEHLYDLKLFLKYNVKIKNILIGVDNITYSVEPSRHLNEAPRKPYINRFNPLIDYLVLLPKYSLYKEILEERKNETPMTYDIHATGGVYIKKAKAYIDRDIEAWINDKRFTKPSILPYYTNRVDKTILEIAEIIAICKQNGINYTFFTNPVHIITYSNLDLDLYYNFIKQLSSLTDFYDFSGVNSITTNNYNYYETSHYRPHIGSLMIKHIFDGLPPTEDNFGKLVSNKNIDAVIAFKKKTLAHYVSKKLNHSTQNKE
ncbi:MAG: hypothetical protein H6584_07025 [Flavobacteriales bacterium]|nr:hypothetical protein [Flavobacteriales bacterium]